MGWFCFAGGGSPAFKYFTEAHKSRNYPTSGGLKSSIFLKKNNEHKPETIYLIRRPFRKCISKKISLCLGCSNKIELGVIPKKIYCHASFAPVMEMFFKLIIERGLTHEINTWDGCYNLRPIRGYEKHFDNLYKAGNKQDAMKYLSCHSWGAAFDINAAWNKLGQPSTLSPELVQTARDAKLTLGR